MFVYILIHLKVAIQQTALLIIVKVDVASLAKVAWVIRCQLIMHGQVLGGIDVAYATFAPTQLELKDELWIVQSVLRQCWVDASYLVKDDLVLAMTSMQVHVRKI